jgi:hypothetical protein
MTVTRGPNLDVNVIADDFGRVYALLHALGLDASDHAHVQSLSRLQRDPDRRRTSDRSTPPTRVTLAQSSAYR